MHRGYAICNCRQDALDALAEPGDGFLDPRAPRFLLVEQRVATFHPTALGNVVVDADPIDGTGNGPIDDRNRAPVGCLIDKADGLADGDLTHDLVAIFLRIATQAAALDATADDLDQRRAGCHNVRRKPVHQPILIIANDEPAAGIEQNDALRHVVQRERQQGGSGLPRAAPEQTIDGPRHGGSPQNLTSAYLSDIDLRFVNQLKCSSPHRPSIGSRW
jgi:hypothetical protein